MRILLQNIELRNFKTYRGTVKVGPLKEFTAIVGPNGSGKSNLLDALSFVLGEDFTKLRVKEPSQLIYGAHVGRPIAVEASVCAIFRSEDGALYIFKRAISKNSIKHIYNEKAVSKKVYLEELEKIGINMQAKNLLVYQGQVEEVALMDAKQRSALIEQASGSIQFKNDYDESKKAKVLAEDKIHMVFSKQRVCRNELKEARLERDEVLKYEQLKEELTIKTQKLQLFKLFHNERDIKCLQEDIASKKSELVEAEICKREAEKKKKQCRKILTEGERELIRVQKEVQEQENEIRKMEVPIIKAREEVSHMTSKVEQAQNSLKKALEVHRNRKLTLRDLRKELAAVEREFQEYQKTVAEESLSQGRDIELEQSQAAEYNSLKVEASKRTIAYQQKIESLIREQKADQDRLENEQRKCCDIESMIKRKEEEKREEINRSNKLLKYIESTESEVTTLHSKQQALKADSKFCEEKIVSVQKELENISSRISEAKYDNNENDFQQRRQQAIEALKSEFPGVFDRLVNLCEPIHRKYSIALTKVMGKLMNAIVVDKEKTARHCIDYLKTKMMGPEEFLPLDFLEVKPLKERLRNINSPKGCKLLFDVVNYDPPQVKQAVLFATKSVVVCETADDAQDVAYELGPNPLLFRDAVSLDGSYFQRNGFISGGSADLAKKAQHWDHKVIAQMKEQKKQLSKELQGILKQARCASEVQNVEREAKGCTTRIEIMRKDYENCLKKIGACDECIKKMRAQHQDLEPEVSNIEALIKERESKLKKLKNKLCSIEDEVFASFCQRIRVSNIREYEESGLRSYEEREKLILEFEGRKNRIQNLIEYEMGAETQSNVDRWTTEIEQRKTALASAAKAVEHQTIITAAVKDKLNQVKDYAARKKDEQNALAENVKEAESEVRKIAEKVECVNKQLAQLEGKCENLKRTRHSLLLHCKVENIEIPPPGCLDDLADEMFQSAESSSASASLDSQSLYDRVFGIEIDYDILDNSLKDLQTAEEIKDSETEMISDVSKISRKLDAQRTPNLRGNFLVEETTEKLRESKEEFKTNREESRIIMDRFERVKKARFDRFMDCFDFVSNEIDNVYKNLTRATSAVAMLVAQDPEEPYLGGVEYNCIAPGKACKHMEDLSGGEKTLASIAFILALHSYKKAPCLVLDEVDAALDNTNISKIASYLSLHKSEFQTVAISLRPEFYGHTDALIGVTKGTQQNRSEVYLFDLEVFPK